MLRRSGQVFRLGSRSLAALRSATRCPAPVAALHTFMTRGAPTAQTLAPLASLAAADFVIRPFSTAAETKATDPVKPFDIDAVMDTKAVSSDFDEERRAKIKEFMLQSSANMMTRARANKKDKMHRFSRWLLFFETWTVVFWLGLGGYVVYRLANADDESFADTLNTAWRNATEFSFDRSKLQTPEAMEAAAAAEKAALQEVLYVLESDDTTNLAPPQQQQQQQKGGRRASG